MCHTIHRHAEANNQYYDTIKESLYLKKVVCEWFQMEKRDFRFDEKFIKKHEDSDNEYTSEVDVKYSKNPH